MNANKDEKKGDNLNAIKDDKANHAQQHNPVPAPNNLNKNDAANPKDASAKEP